jgi:hypothetical protein
MREHRRGHSYCCRIPNVVAVTLLGIATGAGALNGMSAGAQEIRAVGANLIANADFDAGVAGWTPKWFSQGDDENAKSRGWSGSVKWAPGRDYAERHTSGSLELAITAAEGRCAWVTQCVIADPGSYELTGRVFIHATDVHTRGALVSLEVFWVDLCDDSSPARRLTRWFVDPTTAAAGRWTQIADPRTYTVGPDQFESSYGGQGQAGLISNPQGTRGALVQLSACVSGYSKSPETVVADFDHLSLRAISKGNPAPVLDSPRHP